MRNVAVIEPNTFPQFCVSVSPGKTFYAIIGNKVKRCRLAAFQPTWHTPSGITINYRKWGLWVSCYVNAEDFKTTFFSFMAKRHAQAYLKYPAKEQISSPAVTG